jgi:hypothetical protein
MAARMASVTVLTDSRADKTLSSAAVVEHCVLVDHRSLPPGGLRGLWLM